MRASAWQAEHLSANKGRIFVSKKSASTERGAGCASKASAMAVRRTRLPPTDRIVFLPHRWNIIWWRGVPRGGLDWLAFIGNWMTEVDSRIRVHLRLAFVKWEGTTLARAKSIF